MGDGVEEGRVCGEGSELERGSEIEKFRFENNIFGI